MGRYVISGRAELHLEGQMVLLEPGDFWVVPKGSSHTFNVQEPFTVVATRHHRGRGGNSGIDAVPASS